MRRLTLDNDTTIEVFKYLKYCGLAKTSLVSKRFCDLICTHRHKLALLDVTSINMINACNIKHESVYPSVFKIFDKDLSPEEYNEWVIRNGYSKQIPLETQSVGMQSTQYERKMYRLSAYAGCKDLNPLCDPTKVFGARVKLSHENWAVFQHFFRLLTDPFIHIRCLRLPYQEDALNLLAGVINPDCGRLQCHLLTVSLEDNTQNFTSWIKGHVRCFKIYIINWCGLNHDDEFLDLFMTGGNCTSEIEVNFYDPCKAIGNFVQKFMDLKSNDEDKVVGSIECHPNRNVNMDAFNRVYSDFVVEGNINETRGLSYLIFEFPNNDIGKKMRLSINFGYRTTEFTLKVSNS